MLRKLILVLVILGCFCQIGAAEELIQASASIQISSTISDGKLSILEIAEIAKQNDIKIVILTDNDVMGWEYGLWPLRRIIKKTVEANSVFNHGIKNYLRDIEDAQRRNPNLILIAGVECAPFYYWEGRPSGNFKMLNWHKHMLVIGLDNVKDYKMLPSVANRYSLKLPCKFKDIYRLWPILLLIIGILCLRKRKFGYKDLQGRSLGPHSRAWMIFGICIIVFGLLFLINNFPFCSFKYDQYHGEQGVGPYQNLIDYVNSKEGFTFWAHPEAENVDEIGRVSVETGEHADNLLEARDYTGFAVFYDGYNKIGLAGGIWDETLKQYCQGRRRAPVWAIGGLAFSQAGDLGKHMRYLRTIFLVPSLTKQAVLMALREGKMYVVKGKTEFISDEFIVGDTLSDAEGRMGDSIDLSGNAALRISGHFADGRSEMVEVNLIKNGDIIETFEVMSPVEIDYLDKDSSEGKKIYYRLEIHYPGGILVTNPIFAKFKH